MHFLKAINPQETRVFITEGYDCAFKIRKCSTEIMLQDILNQEVVSPMLDSVMYELE